MMMEAGEMEQMEEDIQALRQLLENLVGLSFDQEELIDMNAIGVPAGWVKRLPKCDDNGRHWLGMNVVNAQCTRYESVDRQFVYSPDTGLEMIISKEEE